MGNTAKAFWADETGMGTVEIILIIVVLIGLVIIFKKQLNDLVKKVPERKLKYLKELWTAPSRCIWRSHWQ